MEVSSPSDRLSVSCWSFACWHVNYSSSSVILDTSRDQYWEGGWVRDHPVWTQSVNHIIEIHDTSLLIQLKVSFTSKTCFQQRRGQECSSTLRVIHIIHVVTWRHKYRAQHLDGHTDRDVGLKRASNPPSSTLLWIIPGTRAASGKALFTWFCSDKLL